MGLGPNGSSLLHKMGLKAAHEMPFNEFVALIKAEQDRRTIARSMGRLIRMNKDKPASQARKKPAAKTLESLGFAPEMCTRLRAGGKSDSQLIQILTEKGLI